MTETTELQALCSEVYQAVGILASMSGSLEDASVQALLTNLSDAAEGRPLTHASLLPFYPENWAQKTKAAEGGVHD